MKTIKLSAIILLMLPLQVRANMAQPNFPQVTLKTPADTYHTQTTREITKLEAFKTLLTTQTKVYRCSEVTLSDKGTIKKKGNK